MRTRTSLSRLAIVPPSGNLELSNDPGEAVVERLHERHGYPVAADHAASVDPLADRVAFRKDEPNRLAAIARVERVVAIQAVDHEWDGTQDSPASSSKWRPAGHCPRSASPPQDSHGS